MNASNFADRLLEAIEQKRSHVVVGFDPDYDLLPADVREAYPREAYASDAEMKVDCYRGFLTGVLEAVCADAVAIKMQCAYFEALGAQGYALYEELVGPIRQSGCLVIGDAKRGDIGSTAEAYARAHLEVAGVDAVTVNPYLGSDSVEPFARRAREAGKGMFVLVKTSNPSSAEIQDLVTAGETPVCFRVADLVTTWGKDSKGVCGYSSVGAVVGGTHPSQGIELRLRMPGVPLLVPGYGAQGAGAEDIAGMFDGRGTGAVVNSSRAVLYAYRKRAGLHWRDAARSEVEEMKAALWRAAGRG